MIVLCMGFHQFSSVLAGRQLGSWCAAVHPSVRHDAFRWGRSQKTHTSNQQRRVPGTSPVIRCVWSLSVMNTYLWYMPMSFLSMTLTSVLVSARCPWPDSLDADGKPWSPGHCRRHCQPLVGELGLEDQCVWLPDSAREQLTHARSLYRLAESHWDSAKQTGFPRFKHQWNRYDPSTQEVLKGKRGRH